MCMKLNKLIGMQIRKLRKEKGLSQEKLAVLASVDRSYMGRIERGEVSITVVVLAKILNALKYDLCLFFEGISTKDD